MSNNKASADAQLIELKTKFHALMQRTEQLAESIQSNNPAITRSPAAQEALLLANRDMQLLDVICRFTQEGFHAINIDFVSPWQIQEAGSMVAALAVASSELVSIATEIFGVDPEIVLPTIIKDLTRQVDQIEMIVLRGEASLAATGA